MFSTFRFSPSKTHCTYTSMYSRIPIFYNVLVFSAKFGRFLKGHPLYRGLETKCCKKNYIHSLAVPASLPATEAVKDTGPGLSTWGADFEVCPLASAENLARWSSGSISLALASFILAVACGAGRAWVMLPSQARKAGQFKKWREKGNNHAIPVSGSVACAGCSPGAGEISRY